MAVMCVKSNSVVSCDTTTRRCAAQRANSGLAVRRQHGRVGDVGAIEQAVGRRHLTTAAGGGGNAFRRKGGERRGDLGQTPVAPRILQIRVGELVCNVVSHAKNPTARALMQGFKRLYRLFSTSCARRISPERGLVYKGQGVAGAGL